MAYEYINAIDETKVTPVQKQIIQWLCEGRDMPNLYDIQADVRLIGSVALVRSVMLLEGRGVATGKYWFTRDITLINGDGEQNQIMHTSDLVEPDFLWCFEDTFQSNEYQ